MEFDDIERILELVRQHDLAEFELEREGLKLRVRKTNPGYAPLVAPAAAASRPPCGVIRVRRAAPASQLPSARRRRSTSRRWSWRS